MRHVLEWLLDLEHIRIGRDEPLSIEWHYPYGGWVLWVAALAIVVFVTVVYQRERTSRRRRAILAVIRLAILVLVAAMICRPVLVLLRERAERSHVALLIDCSRSMSETDRYTDPDRAAAIATGAGASGVSDVQALPRLDLVRRALLANDAQPLRVLLDSNEVHLYGFAGSAKPHALTESVGQLDALTRSLANLTADGATTALANAFREVGRRSRGGRLAAVVLVSDGRSTEPGADAIRQAQALNAPVYTAPIGSPAPRIDIAVGPSAADPNVFENDLLAVTTTLSATGLDAPISVRVNLIDEARNTLVASETVELTPESPARDVELRTKATGTGTIRYRIETDAIPNEWDTDNNSDSVALTVQSEPLRVLYVEGYPRFEYRYLKNTLLRERSIRVSCLLLSADEEFAQEGDDPIRRFPETIDELNRYDVLLLGDVNPNEFWLGPTRSNLIVEFVSERGGGFGLIAGERFAPHRFVGTALEKLIPVRIDPGFTGTFGNTLTTAFQLHPTPEGYRSRLFRYRAENHANRELIESLPGLHWLARTLGPRPGAEVLAEHPSLQAADGMMPIAVTGRYGAGKTFFLATDESWRWRRYTGEWLHDTYWVQLIRHLAPSKDVGQDSRVAIRPDRTGYRVGDRVELHVHVPDTRLLTGLGTTVPLTVRDAGGHLVARLQADRLSPASGLFECSWLPRRGGRYSVQAPDLPPPPGQRPAAAEFRVDDTSLEGLTPEADLDTLRRLSEQTGGAVIELDKLSEGFGRIEDRSVRVPDDLREPLWRTKLAWILFVILIAAEWITRKISGIV